MAINLTDFGRSLIEGPKPKKGNIVLTPEAESWAKEAPPVEAPISEITPTINAAGTVQVPQPSLFQKVMNSPFGDVITGGMSQQQADQAAIANKEKIMAGMQAFLSGGMPVSENPKQINNIGDIGNNIVEAGKKTLKTASDAAQLAFAPEIAIARGVGGAILPEQGKTPLESAVKDVISDPGTGVYGERLAGRMVNGQDTPESASLKAVLAGLAGTGMELATFSPKTVIEGVKGAKDAYTLGQQKKVLDAINDDLPELKDTLRKQKPDLPSDVIDSITPEHVIQAAQVHPEIADYVNRVQNRVNPLNKLGLSTEDVSKPEDISPAADISKKTQETSKKVDSKEIDNVVNDLQNTIKEGEAPIPEFYNTTEAHAFADKATPEQMAQIQILKDQAIKEGDDAYAKTQEYRKALKQPDITPEAKAEIEKNLTVERQKAQDISAKATKYREVVEKYQKNQEAVLPPIEPPETATASPAPEDLPPENKAVQEIVDIVNSGKPIGFSPEVNKYLAKVSNVNAVGKMLEAQVPADKYRKIINSNVGVKRTSASVTANDASLLKRELQQEQIASKQGFKAGQEVGQARAENIAENKLADVQRKAELGALKQDIIARDKRTAAISSLKNLFHNKMEEQLRAGELGKLKQDILAREKDKVKKEVINYIKDVLPIDARGKYLTAIGNAKDAAKMSEVFRRVDKHAGDIKRKEIVGKLRTSIGKAVGSNKVAVEYKDRLEKILDSIDLKKRRPETLDALRETQKYIDRQKAEGKDVDMPNRIMQQLSSLKRKALGDISTAELQNMLDHVDQLSHFGEVKQRTRENIYNLEKERKTKELLGGTVALDKNPILQPDPGEKIAFKDKLKNIFPTINNFFQHLDLAITPMDTFTDLLDGGNGLFNGPNYRIFKKALDTKYQNYLVASNKYVEEAVSLARELKLDDQNFERIGIHAARMQKGGREKLLDTGLTEKQIDKIVLSDSEEKFYKMMRKNFDALRPSVADTMRDVWNQPLGEVENYVSFMTDFEKMSDAEVFRRIGENAPETRRPTKTPEKGFTKERTGGTQAIKLNAMDIYLRHIDNVTYLVNMSRDLKMLYEIANSKEYGKVAGDIGQTMMMEWLDLMSRKGGIAGEQRIAFLDILRRNFGLAQLGLNISSALIQPTAVIDGAMIIGQHAFDGLYKVITDVNVRKFVIDNMPEIKNRIGDDPAFIDFGNSFMKKLQQVGFGPLKALDGLTASGVGFGAYVQKIKELGLPLDLNSPNKEAISYAEEIVRRTQSSSLFKDAPLAISKGKLTGNRSFDKAILQFQSFMLTRWNNIRNYMWRSNIQGGRTADKSSRDFGKAALTLTMLASAVAMETELRRGISDARDKILGNKIRRKDSLIVDAMQNLASVIPFISQGVSMLTYGGSPIPSFSPFNDAYAAVKQLSGKRPETKKKGVVDVAKVAAEFAGIPGVTEVARAAKGIIDAGTKKNVAEMYREAIRNSSKVLKEKADVEANRQGLLISKMEDNAQEYVDREIKKAYENAILRNSKELKDVADGMAKKAGYSDGDIMDTEEDVIASLEKRKEKFDQEQIDLSEQKSTFKSAEPSVMDRAKQLLEKFIGN